MTSDSTNKPEMSDRLISLMSPTPTNMELSLLAAYLEQKSVYPLGPRVLAYLFNPELGASGDLFMRCIYQLSKSVSYKDMGLPVLLKIAEGIKASESFEEGNWANRVAQNLVQAWIDTRSGHKPFMSEPILPEDYQQKVMLREELGLLSAFKASSLLAEAESDKAQSIDDTVMVQFCIHCLNTSIHRLREIVTKTGDYMFTNEVEFVLT